MKINLTIIIVVVVGVALALWYIKQKKAKEEARLAELRNAGVIS